MAEATINDRSFTYDRTSGIHLMAVLCAAAEGRALIKKNLQQRILRTSGTPVFTVICTVKFNYLQIHTTRFSIYEVRNNSIGYVICLFWL